MFNQDLISGLHSPGLLARVPTHRPGCCHPRRKARYRPAGFALVGRDLYPLDGKLNFDSYRIAFSFQTSLAWSHRWTTTAPPITRLPCAR